MQNIVPYASINTTVRMWIYYGCFFINYNLNNS